MLFCCLGLREHLKDALPSLEIEGARRIPRRAKRNAARCDKRSGRRQPVARRASGASATYFREEVAALPDLPAQTVSSTDISMLFRQNSETAMSYSRGKLKSHGFLAALVHGVGKSANVIRINCERVPRAADRYIKLFPVHELGREPRIDVHDDPIDGRALRGVRSRSVSVIDVAEAVGRDAHRLGVV